MELMILKMLQCCCLVPVRNSSILSTVTRCFRLQNPLLCLYHRHASNDASNHHNLKRAKLVKRLFSTFLFGLTFLTAIVLKRQKKKKVRDYLKDCEQLPQDANYRGKITFYRYKGFVFPEVLLTGTMQEVETFDVREDDIFVVSFPKAGTTWVQEIVYLLATDLKFDLARSANIERRFPFLEYMYPGVGVIKKLTSPRFIKTHIPASLLPSEIHDKKPKIVCILRNPKDVVVSYYYFLRMLKMTDYTGSFNEFLKAFMKGSVPYGPFWKHYLEWWNERHQDNVLIVFYEDLHKDIRGSIEKIATFLGKNLSPKEVDKIAWHCSFQQMVQNPSVNYQHWDDLGLRNKSEAKFMRKGEVGDWKNYFDQKANHDMDNCIKEHFEREDLSFTYEL